MRIFFHSLEEPFPKKMTISKWYVIPCLGMVNIKQLAVPIKDMHWKVTLCILKNIVKD